MTATETTVETERIRFAWRSDSLPSNPMSEASAHALSEYVERFWTPIVGPAAIVLYRHLARQLSLSSIVAGDVPTAGDIALNVATLAHIIGAGNARDQNDRVDQVIDRLIHNGMLTSLDGTNMYVARRVHMIPRRKRHDMPAAEQTLHALVLGLSARARSVWTEAPS